MQSLNEDQSANKIIEVPNINYVPDERGIGYIYFTQMKKHQEKIAQIDALTGKKDKFSSLFQRCIRTSLTMRSKGIATDDIVTICSFNHFNSIVPFIATFFLGAKVASLDPLLSLDDTIHLLKQVRPKTIFVVSKALDMIERAVKEVTLKSEIVVFEDARTHSYSRFSEFLLPTDGEEIFEPVIPKSLQDTAIIFFSSGTSGLPKGICISQHSLLMQTMNLMSLGLNLDVILSFASLYWIASAIFCSISVINGTSRLILPKLDSAIIWEKIHEFKPTFMFLTPSRILALASHEKPAHIKSDSLQDIFISGGPISENHILRMRTIFPKSRVSLAYGLTEMCGFVACFKPNNPKCMDALAYKTSSAGSGFPGLSFKVVDIETEGMLGPYQKGELRLSADYLMNCYYNMNCSDVWDSDGWLRTGDIVYYDEDKYLYIVDRIKEILKFQAWHVPPAVIENIILTHPAIENAVVIGVPHEEDGDHPMAIITLKKESSCGITPDDIEKYVEERVHDRQRLRGGVRIVSSIPTTPSGKIKRMEVKRMIFNK